MDNTIAIIGAGGFGREVAQIIHEINSIHFTWNLIGFYDDQKKKDLVFNQFPVLGNLQDGLNSQCKNFIIAIADVYVSKNISDDFLSRGKNFPNIKHPSANVSYSFNTFGHGNIFSHGFHMTTNICIGSFNLFNTRVCLGHDVSIGSHNIFLPNVQISGNVKIGDQNFFGMNSSVIEKKTIGYRNKIGGHSFVVTNLESDTSVFGIPAKRI